tara:strand:- start:13891 stop:14361 length:471 start_codon:yes stop_codon:yes gene_type:complete
MQNLQLTAIQPSKLVAQTNPQCSSRTDEDIELIFRLVGLTVGFHCAVQKVGHLQLDGCVLIFPDLFIQAVKWLDVDIAEKPGAGHVDLRFHHGRVTAQVEIVPLRGNKIQVFSEFHFYPKQLAIARISCLVFGTCLLFRYAHQFSGIIKSLVESTY